MNITMRTILAAVLVGSLPHAAMATTTVVPGSSCQLSIPTTDTKFRPKATGARNESTTVSNFVICPIAAPASLNPALGQSFGAVSIELASLDGATRAVSCTAVTGNTDGAPAYSSKTASISSAGGLSWYAPDFGGVAGDLIPNGAFMTVTCLLPPQTAIQYAEGEYIAPP